MSAMVRRPVVWIVLVCAVVVGGLVYGVARGSGEAAAIVVVSIAMSFSTAVWMQASRTKRWPEAIAEVEQLGTAPTVCGSMSGEGYEVVVRYRYVVNGKAHQGDRFAWCARVYASDRGTMREIKAVRSMLRDDGRIPIHYNPHKPDESVVLTGATSSAWLMLVFAASIAALTAVIIVARHRG